MNPVVENSIKNKVIKYKDMMKENFINNNTEVDDAFLKSDAIFH